jgi:hypothetical protein
MVTVYIKKLLLSGLTKVSYDFITSIFEHKITQFFIYKHDKRRPKLHF